MNPDLILRRLLLKRVAALGMLAVAERLVPAYAVTNTIVNPGSQTPLGGDVIDLTISEELFHLDGWRTGRAMTINGTIPGPVIRLKEGQQATLRVTNRLEEPTSIHWHGLLLPPEMDGVPGVSFAGIEPGTTFTYCFSV
jgi:FtsP/CotA-like multicopper oxidase with cupredoxin domain